jgi:hypothetical protein
LSGGEHVVEPEREMVFGGCHHFLCRLERFSHAGDEFVLLHSLNCQVMPWSKAKKMSAWRHGNKTVQSAFYLFISFPKIIGCF